MSYTALLKAIGDRQGQRRDLSLDEACALFGAMLDGGVPDFELGALLIALRAKGECAEEIEGAAAALAKRTNALPCQIDKPPVILPSYGVSRQFANLTPLLALLLQRFGVPVLIHGELDSHGGVGTAYVLRELGVMPAASVSRAELALLQDGIAFVPIGVLSPGIAQLLVLRNRIGLRHIAHQVVKLLIPMPQTAALTLISATLPAYLQNFRTICSRQRRQALILLGTEGEPFADPRRRPEIELSRDGKLEMLFGAETASFTPPAPPPAASDASATARWIRSVLAGQVPVPVPLVNQLACCLYGVGYAKDMNQAKAIAAVETGSLGRTGMRGAA